MESGDLYRRKEVSGHFPEYGAIFMSNRSTFKECLEKRLLGLPAPFSSFVRSVKAGMILFLFEFEERKLYGVFEAISDGGMNIVPHAYISSGRKFPAQVKFTTIWHCDPLFEDEFRDAIRDNYFDTYKFNFGLSKDQIQSLLWLFDSKKLEIPKSLHHNKRKSRMRDYKSIEAGLKKGRFTEISEPEMERLSLSSDSCRISESIRFDDDAYDPEHPGFHRSEGSGAHSASSHESHELLALQQKKGNSHISAKESLDFIPLLASDHSDSEEEGLALRMFVGNQVSSIPVPQFLHTDILSNKGYNQLKMEHPFASPHGSGHVKSVQSKGLYSDKSKTRASVFSRLNFSSKYVASKNQNDASGKLVNDMLRVKHRNHEECEKMKEVTQQKHEIGDCKMNKRTSVFLRLTSASDAVVQPVHCMTELKEGNSEWKKAKEKSNFQNGNINA
ncbi:B2 protein [Spatholobus suberectus]|nr:B2 protein [Spatholobus suberectus]